MRYCNADLYEFTFGIKPNGKMLDGSNFEINAYNGPLQEISCPFNGKDNQCHGMMNNTMCANFISDVN